MPNVAGLPANTYMEVKREKKREVERESRRKKIQDNEYTVDQRSLCRG